jgi:hypothetical protein
LSDVALRMRSAPTARWTEGVSFCVRERGDAHTRDCLSVLARVLRLLTRPHGTDEVLSRTGRLSGTLFPRATFSWVSRKKSGSSAGSLVYLDPINSGRWEGHGMPGPAACTSRRRASASLTPRHTSNSTGSLDTDTVRSRQNRLVPVLIIDAGRVHTAATAVLMGNPTPGFGRAFFCGTYRGGTVA